MGYFSSKQNNIQERGYQEITFMGNGTRGTCLVDSGNLVGSAMNLKTFEKLQIPLISHKSEGKAAQGDPLDILGITEPIEFGFNGQETTSFKEAFIVIKNLSHEVNIGANFLQKNQAIHHHETGVVVLQKPGGKEVPIQLYGKQEVKEKITEKGSGCGSSGPAYVYSQVHVRIPAGTAKYIPVAIPAFKEDMDVLIEPFQGTKNPALLAKSVSKFQNGRTITVVYNPLKHDVQLERWCRIGEATQVGFRAEEKWAVLGDMSGPDDVKKKNKEDYTEIKDKRAWLNQQFRLQESEELAANPACHRQVEDMLLKYWDCISKTKTDYGKTDLMELEIDLTPGAKPFKGHNRQLNPRQEDDLHGQLEAWEREDVIEDSNSPWGAPLIPALKKDGRLRWCVDFRKLNDVTVKDSYPLPLIQANLHKLGKSKIFSTLDGTGAYHNISISERDRPLTAFLTPWGQYQFKRMPFGLCNAPQAYSRLVEMVLRGLDPRQVLAYLDDIILHSRTIQEHLDMLERVLHAHRKAGLKIAPAKSFLCRHTVDYLGHRVSEQGIEMLDDYVKLLVDWPKPTTSKQLATFLGKCGYYRQFIRNYGQIAACLEAEKKKPILKWTPQMDISFIKLREAFKHKPILAFPDFENGENFILDTDWSKEGMAQIISQKQKGEDGERERLIACGGRKCTQAERNYSSNKGETASFVDGLDRFEHILRYAPFKARVDNRCLSYIRNLKKPTGIYLRWLEFIDSFQFEVNHRAGKKHGNVDALSRADHLPPPTQQQIENSEEFLCSMVEELNEETLGAIQAEAEKEQILPISNKQLRRAQTDDEDLGHIRKYVIEGRKPTKEERKMESKAFQQLCQDFELLYIHKNVIYRKILAHEPRLGANDRLCIPNALQDKALYWAHAHDSVGHLGIGATQKRVRARFFFPGLYNKVESYVLGCHKCLQKRGAPARLNLPPHHTQRGFPGARWSLDLVGPMPRTEQGNAYIMTAEDVFTRWPIAVPIPDKTAEGIAAAVEKYIIAEHGVCQELLTDNALEFTGHVINDVARILGIKKVQTVPYNPNANPIERFHRTLGEMLRTTVKVQQTDWEDKLPAALLAYRTSVHNTTKMTPFYLTHGREARLPIDVIFPRPPQKAELRTNYSVKLRENLDEAFAFVREQQNKVIKREAALYNGTLEGKTLEEGDLVWYYTPRQEKGQVKKLHRGWIGPMKITKAISEVTYLITPEGDWTDKRPIIPCVVHRLKRYNKDTALPMQAWGNITTEQLVQHLVDTVDENLEATGEVNIPTKWQEQTSYYPIKISFPHEEADMVDLGPIDMLVGQNTKMLPEEDTVLEEKDETMTLEEDDNVETQDGQTEKTPVIQQQTAQIVDITHVVNKEADPVQKGKRQREDDIVQVHQTRQRTRMETEQRNKESADTVTPQARGSTHSVNSATNPAIPLYMAAGAEAAAVRTSPRQGKRQREDSNTASVQETSKLIKTDEGINSMTLNFEDMNLHTRKEGEEDEPDTLQEISQVCEPCARSLSEQVGPMIPRGVDSEPNRVIEIPFHRIQIHAGGMPPVRSSIQAAGHDCFARTNSVIRKGTTGAIPLGFSMAPSYGTYARLAETSTWPVQHPGLVLRAGVVDPDFRGELAALVTYLGPEEEWNVRAGDRICQLVAQYFLSAPYQIVRTLPRTGRGRKAGYQQFINKLPAMPGGVGEDLIHQQEDWEEDKRI
jgi:dUTPase